MTLSALHTPAHLLFTSSGGGCLLGGVSHGLGNGHNAISSPGHQLAAVTALCKPLSRVTESKISPSREGTVEVAHVPPWEVTSPVHSGPLPQQSLLAPLSVRGSFELCL